MTEQSAHSSPSTSNSMAPPSTRGGVRYQLEMSQMNCPGASPWAVGSALLLQVKGMKKTARSKCHQGCFLITSVAAVTEAEHSYK